MPRGLLRREVDPEVILMICTAGHVDHGKTALVRLLTGCNTDRLKEEQERGLTIELGFAPCFLGGNLCAGIVDVPGHEKFVRTMVAGVSGIDMTLLVIAADDGIMPQTLEHFQIMDLLGVRTGLVALTKTDLVSRERVAEVAGEIRAFLRGTFLDGAPVCPVSSVTFDGYDEFYEALVSRVRSIGKRKRAGLFRMPIERTFAKQGFGSVVTGIPVDGAVQVGDEVEIVPGGQRGRVRGIQRFLRDAAQGGFGQCLALNIPLLKTPPERGQVVCAPSTLTPSRTFHVELKAVAGLSKAIQHAEAVRFHSGTIDIGAKVFLLEGKTLGGGESMLASVILSEPVAAAAHDRFILRRPSPATTIGGGEILATSDVEARQRKQDIVDRLRSYREALAGVDPASVEGLSRRAEWWLRIEKNGGAEKKAGAEEKSGATFKELAAWLMTSPEMAGQALRPLLESGAVVALGGEGQVRGGAGLTESTPLTGLTPLTRLTGSDRSVGSDGSGGSSPPTHSGEPVAGKAEPAANPPLTAYLIHHSALAARLSETQTRIDTARKTGGALSLAPADVRGGEDWPAPVWGWIQQELARRGVGEMKAGRFVLCVAADQFSPTERDLLNRLYRIYEETGFQSPRPEDAAAQLRLDPKPLNRFFEHLFNEGRLVRLSPAVILTRDCVAKAQRLVIEAVRKNGTLDSADFKYQIDSSRKYALAILDFFDSRRVTIRVGNLRKLAPDYERHLL